MVGWPFQRVGTPFRRFGCGRKSTPEVRECSRRYSGGLGVVRRPSKRFGSGREALPEVQGWSGGPLGGS